MLDELIESASRDPAKVPDLCRALLMGHVTIIATWADPESDQIQIQDFMLNGESYLPLFSTKEEFDREIKGAAFEQRGVSIDCRLFISILRGTEKLILNPASAAPVNLRKSDFEPFFDDAGYNVK